MYSPFLLEKINDVKNVRTCLTRGKSAQLAVQAVQLAVQAVQLAVQAVQLALQAVVARALPDQRTMEP